MIYYFSGTGNSEWVAKELARLVGDSAMDVSEFIKNSKTPDDCSGYLGLVFPIYAWGAPVPVVEFAKTIPSGDAFRFAVCTCGHEAGYAMDKLKKVFPWTSAYSISMPNNYVVGSDVDTPEQAKPKIEAAGRRLEEMASAIKAKRTETLVTPGSKPWLKTNIVNPLFNMSAKNTKDFYAESSCTGCGLCEKKCPLGNIKLADGKPVWGNNCTQCLSCINRCPAAAIQYGKNTKTRGRYYFGRQSAR